jgi:hypothetical protein
MEMSLEEEKEIKFIRGDFQGDLFRLVFMAGKFQVRVNLTKNEIRFPLQSLYEVKKQLTEKQLLGLLKLIFDYTFDLN